MNDDLHAFRVDRDIAFFDFVLQRESETACVPPGFFEFLELSVEGIDLSPALRFSKDWFLGGLLFLVLSTIFRHGTELEEEKALTV